MQDNVKMDFYIMLDDVCAGYHQCGEVLKVPMFVEHYMEYHGSLSEFVMEHYDNHKKMRTGILIRNFLSSIRLLYSQYMPSFRNLVLK
ncbi:hypothetical protein EJ377_21285 [Chryseobacterium arthrosphaerae]|uniref:Uncharacterized protein n=1 Tax=Chryseobacterium arthrosphaerae TaxID=651561 RepID=A0A3S0PPF2_9FLAO|nr:hypothetical protein EJ377_21285 [Chryseobacterium arthrosphaerae]